MVCLWRYYLKNLEIILLVVFMDIYTTVSELVIKNKGEEICNSNLNPYYLLII